MFCCAGIRWYRWALYNALTALMHVSGRVNYLHDLTNARPLDILRDLQLKAWTRFRNKYQCSHLVYPNICINDKTHLWKCWHSWSSKLQENILKKKTRLLILIVCFLMPEKDLDSNIFVRLQGSRFFKYTVKNVARYQVSCCAI